MADRAQRREKAPNLSSYENESKPRSNRRTERGSHENGTSSPGQGAARGRRRSGTRRRSRAAPSVERVMLVHGEVDFAQIAVLEEGAIVEHYVARATDRSIVGN